MSKKTQHNFIANEAEKAPRKVVKKKPEQGVTLIELLSSITVLVLIVTLVLCLITNIKMRKQQTQAQQKGPRTSINNVDTTIAPQQHGPVTAFDPVNDDSHRSEDQRPSISTKDQLSVQWAIPSDSEGKL